MKALASQNHSWLTSAWSFFGVGCRLAQAGELVSDADELLGQLLNSVFGDFAVSHSGQIIYCEICVAKSVAIAGVLVYTAST